MSIPRQSNAFHLPVRHANLWQRIFVQWMTHVKMGVLYVEVRLQKYFWTRVSTLAYKHLQLFVTQTVQSSTARKTIRASMMATVQLAQELVMQHTMSQPRSISVGLRSNMGKYTSVKQGNCFFFLVRSVCFLL